MDTLLSELGRLFFLPMNRRWQAGIPGSHWHCWESSAPADGDTNPAKWEWLLLSWVLKCLSFSEIIINWSLITRTSLSQTVLFMLLSNGMLSVVWGLLLSSLSFLDQISEIMKHLAYKEPLKNCFDVDLVLS